MDKERVKFAPEDLVCYSYDATNFIELPGVIVFPKTTAEVSQVLQIAKRWQIPVTTRGGGTNLVGGTVPTKDSLVLSTQLFNQIVEINEEQMYAVVEPGLITRDLHRAVEARGLFYPPDPAALNMSTMGGNVGENAGGPRGFKYGVTRDYLLGLTVVLMDGRVVKVGGKSLRDQCGYDFTRLFAASEGTLGVITEIIVRLIPLPEAKQTMLALFSQLEQAAEAVAAIIKHMVVPTTLELMSKEIIELIERRDPVGYPQDVGAALLLEVDGAKVDLQEQIEKIQKVCLDEGATSFKLAADQADADRLWLGRRNAFGLMAQSFSTVYPEDATVPRNKVPEMVRRMREIGERNQIGMLILGHMGDGNLHPNICIDDSEPGAVKRAEKAIDELFAAALECGGTLSGEHGIGQAKKKYFSWQFNETAISSMKALKRNLDPLGLLNPGKMFDLDREEGQNHAR
ncbi:MAG: FAD-linked oxidase C-terminal domain-containing protein [Desulfitobacteriaceae bacterium]|nr:FAD-linked oxidase C-terminal domain-containing protein [Desulfitobacteriaceae bacterium]MDI6877857.1 FAD-linked oxidase C-terminal domain-containing protein [Desulfitobacteriaceae bacterium]MDI6912742.1 FAD-linked oxidase C-terminal domain-containing protein [Desulfitobacteriaceae bacterium]